MKDKIAKAFAALLIAAPMAATPALAQTEIRISTAAPATRR